MKFYLPAYLYIHTRNINIDESNNFDINLICIMQYVFAMRFGLI